SRDETLTMDSTKEPDKPARAEKPQALSVLAENIPADLTRIPHWVTWRYVEETGPETGEIHYDKPPRNARIGGLASSVDPGTWSKFDEALAAYQRGGLDGIGFVLHRQGNEVDGLVGIDLDKCRDHDTEAIEEWALQIVREINSYTEISPSGRGLRIFL